MVMSMLKLEWYSNHCNYTLEEACWLVLNIIPIGGYAATWERSWGIRFVHDHLKRIGYKITRAKVQEVLKTMMPNVMERRQMVYSKGI